MNFELLEQSVQYTFSSESYTNGKLTRTLKNVAKDATASALAQVGQALSSCLLYTSGAADDHLAV